MGGIPSFIGHLYNAEQSASRRVGWGDLAHVLGGGARGLGNMALNGVLAVDANQGLGTPTPNTSKPWLQVGLTAKQVKALKTRDALVKSVQAALANPKPIKVTHTWPPGAGTPAGLGDAGVSHLPGGAPSATAYVPPGPVTGTAGDPSGGATGGGTGTTRTTAAATGGTDFAALLKNLFAGLPAKAHALALQDVNAQVAALKAQQAMLNHQAAAQGTLLNNQAAERAHQIGLASADAANMFAGVGDRTLQAAQSAARDQAAMASGYSGMLGDTARAAADKVAADLASRGLPATTKGAAGLDTAGQAQGLGNILYSTGGALPASTLEQQGLASAAFQRTLPGAVIGGGKAQSLATLAAGQQQAHDALLAGQTQAQGIIPQIAGAKGQLPKLTTGYLTSLQSTAQNQALLPALIAGGFDKLPGINPVTGAPTSKQTAADQAQQRINIERNRVAAQLKTDATRLEIATNNSLNSQDRLKATIAYQNATLELRRAGLRAGAMKKSTSDAAKAAAWVQNNIQGYTKGSGAGASTIPPNTDFKSLYMYVVNAWPSLAVAGGKPAYNIVASMLAPPPEPYKA